MGLKGRACVTVKYADGTSILAPIVCPTTSQDLQEYLTVIDSWIVSDHLKLSPPKSSVMNFSSFRQPAKPSSSMRGIPFPRRIDRKSWDSRSQALWSMDFSFQVAGVAAKARRVLGFVSRVSKPCGPATFSLLYTSLVLLILVYGCAVTSSTLSKVYKKKSLVQPSRTSHKALGGRLRYPLEDG
ncbi:hypothetical protein HPB52_017626 [Rhipicephalus sanguineus]|uniref:Uncharacterized protein n=1 Tax=Rhipicephalus sanguineus TaxID=34632 RepID=A0A9D4YQH2_RHISA|nr:hypothetical protein HPB52_017626 [Rhipicephalus sanguineus]